jgi:hypothetical protein
MKKNLLFVFTALPVLFLLVSCKKEKNDPYDLVSNKWLFKSITVDNINPNGVVYKTKTFNNTYEDNDLTLDPSGMYEVRYLPTFMFNATYCFKGEDSDNNHKGIWEFDRKKKQMWFDRGITEYFNSSSGLEFSQKYDYSIEGNQMILESTDPKVIADFGYNIGSYYFSGLWNYMSDDDSTEGDSDGYRNGYWYGYYWGCPYGEQAILRRDAFYSYWSIGVADHAADTAGVWQYPNYQSGYINGYNTGYTDGLNDASFIDNNTKTYKMKIVYTKL